eukprot:m.258907 g.258907  ORF g.258907 m.258907 type:complete len:86 (+) comp37246_c0_seq1:763-1020(+)
MPKRPLTCVISPSSPIGLRSMLCDLKKSYPLPTMQLYHLTIIDLVCNNDTHVQSLPHIRAQKTTSQPHVAPCDADRHGPVAASIW